MIFGRGILLVLSVLSASSTSAQTAPNEGGPMGEWARMVEVNLSAPVITSENGFRVFVKYTPKSERELGIAVQASNAFLSSGGACSVRIRGGAVRGIEAEQDDTGDYRHVTFGDSTKPIVGSIDFSCDAEVSADQQVTIQLKSWVALTQSRQGQARHVFNQLHLVSQR
jgi:hypothetical protein